MMEYNMFVITLRGSDTDLTVKDWANSGPRQLWAQGIVLSL